MLSIPFRLLPVTLATLAAALALADLAPPEEAVSAFTIVLACFVACSADVSILALRMVGLTR